MAVAPGLGKLVPLAVGFQWIFRCQCFETDVLTDAMPLGFSMLETEPSPFSLDEVRFHCSVAPLKTARECMGPKNGGCRAGNKCFTKDDGHWHIYATCCCSQTDTPIEIIEHNSSLWSCFASEVDSLRETHGKTPFCAIHCCLRPGVSRSCHGNKPICCNASKDESCGITLQGEPCCAAHHKEANATCCHNLGTTCWYSPFSWMVVPFSPGTPCCMEHLPDMICASQSSCSKGFGGALGLSGASVLATAGVQAFFYMKGSGADFLPGRKWCWYLKMVAPSLCLFFLLHAVVYISFLHIWEKVTPAQTARVCVWWALWSLLAMQATVCVLIRVLRALNRQRRPSPAGDHFPRDRRGVRIAILINIQEYVNSRIWSHVYDESFVDLARQLTESGWQVFTWYDLTKNQVEAMLGQTEPHLRGANGPIVWMHISSHSQTVFGCPQFLPADAGVFGDGVSIFKLVRKLSSVAGCRARIHVTLNGCMEIPRGLERFVWWWRYGWSQEDFRLSSGRFLLPRREAQAWILFACHPGRAVPGNQEQGGIFTRRILRALRDHLGADDSEIELYYDAMISDLKTPEDTVRVRFHPYLITTGSTNPSSCDGIPRQSSQETTGSTGTQSTAASSGALGA